MTSARGTFAETLKEPTRPPARATFGREAISAAAAAVLATIVAAWSLRLWDWQIGTPWDLHWDAIWVSTQIRDAIDHGWYWSNPDLGYPFGQVGSLFPELNVLHLAIIKVISFVVPGAYTPGVVYFVLGFPLSAVTMYLLARHEKIAPPAAIAIGVLFACAPGHQEKFGHLWLSSYWVIPPAVWVILKIVRGRQLLSRRAGQSGWRSLVTVRSGLVLGALIAIGLSGVYYAAFILILLGVAAVARRLAGGSAVHWAPGLGAMALVTMTILLPLVIAREGASAATLVGRAPTARAFAESELFAGKLMDLMLPWPGHRVDALAHLTWAYNAVTTPTVEVVALGVVALVGCLTLVSAASRALLGLPVAGQLRIWALFAGTSLSFFLIGGLGSFTALFFTGVVRTWSRMSLLILLFGLLAVGFWLTALIRRAGRVIGVTVAAAVLVIGVLDQTNPARAPDHRENASHFADLTAYTRRLKEAVGPGCAVFQLPVTSFPESAGANRMGGYNQLFPYLASNQLRWSYGAMRNTAEAEWQRAVPLDDERIMVRDLAAAGFCAVEVDTYGFLSATDPRAALAAQLGAPVSTTSDGEFVAYEIPRELAVEGSRDRLVKPVLVALDANMPFLDGGAVSQWAGPQVGLRVVNLSNDAVPLRITLNVEAAGSAAREVAVAGANGGSLAKLKVEPGRSIPITFEVSAPKGVSVLPITFSGDPVRLSSPSLTVAAKVSDIHVTTTSAVRAVSVQQQIASGAVTIG